MRIEPFLELSHRDHGRAATALADLPMSMPQHVPIRGGRAEEDAPDPHHMSPRQFAEWAYDLYLEGVMRWQDYRLAGFPSELHPSFEATIGALTGEKAEPDRPRDMLLEWERRHAFERRHHGRESAAAARCARIIELLRREAEGRVSRPRPGPAATR
jgi:hypothetical protein